MHAGSRKKGYTRSFGDKEGNFYFILFYLEGNLNIDWILDAFRELFLIFILLNLKCSNLLRCCGYGGKCLCLTF